MTDAERIQRLSADVDRLVAQGGQLDGAAGDPEHRQLIGLAQQLAALDLGADVALRQRVHRRVSARLAAQDGSHATRFSKHKGASQMMTMSKRRGLAWGAVPALVLLALMLAFTPLQTYARDMLVRIGLITITHEPTSLEQFLSQPPAPPQEGAPTAAPPVLSSAQLYTPGYLPAGYEAQPGYQGMQYVRVTAAGTDYLRIYALDPAHQTLPVGEAPVTMLSVRGVEAAFVEGAHLYVKDLGGPMLHDELQPELTNLLLWEEGGRIVVVESGALGQAELVRIAEALH